MPLIKFTSHGIYCPQADVYIDPNRKVKKALITHGHSDHAKPGHENYLCVDNSVAILKLRLGKINIESLPYNKQIDINGVQISFHPAGHVIGSAQIRLEYKGEVCVVSGDYKLEDDNISEAYEPLKCNSFVTESTFALPIYNWEVQEKVYDQMNNWWIANSNFGKTSLISAYSLGKAQRILANLNNEIGEIYCHSAIQKMNETLIKEGYNLPNSNLLTENIDPNKLKGALILGPPAALTNLSKKELGQIEFAAASGWNQLRARRKSKSIDKAFILSDHADWKGLIKAVKATNAEQIYVTHGYSETFAQYLNENGFNAKAV